jgi:biotin-(acetyl-CoA carboxylase) ligase
VQASAARLSDVLPALRPDDLLEPIVSRLREQLPRGPLLLPEEVEAFRRRDWLRDRRIREPEAGIACGIEADGALRIKKANGEIVKVRAGRVVLGP